MKNLSNKSIKLTVLVFAIATLLPFYSRAQSVEKKNSNRFSSSVGIYFNLPYDRIREMEAISLTYRFLPSYGWGASLNLGKTGLLFAKPQQTYFFFGTLTLAHLPIHMDRLRMTYNIGCGVAHGKQVDPHGGLYEELKLEKFTKFITDVSVDVQYAITTNSYCGLECRIMTNGTKTFSYCFLGLKLGCQF